MSSRKMLSRRQCVFVIIVLPMLIIPAMFILKHADGGLAEVFIPPKRATLNSGDTLRSRQEANLTVKKIKMPPVKPKPRKCFDYIWTGACRDTCYTYNTLAKQRQRKQQIMKCDQKKTQLKILYTTKQKYVYKVPFQDGCLRRILDWYCHDDKKVPNIVHYVWFGKNEFTFIHFLSFLSVHRFQNPCLIMVHADKLPKGKLWIYFLQISPKVIHVQRKAPKKVYKKKLAYVGNKADIAKLEALKEYGGIYLDTDQVLLKSVDKFRYDDVTLGLDYGMAISNSIIFAKKNAPFIKYWYESYKSYSRTDGNKHSQTLPYKLAEKYKDKVHIIGDKFSFPNVHQLSALYSKNINWGDKYGMHMHLKLHDRFYTKQFEMNSIKSLNTTAGAVARHILYGNTEPCSAKTVIQ